MILELFLFLFGTYLLLGLAFAIAFVTFGVTRIDPSTQGTSVMFRLLILPGSIIFWPVLVRRWSSHLGKGESR